MPEVQVSDIQEAGVDRAEVGARRFVLHLVWILPCVLIFGWFFQANFQALHMPEAMDAAQLARHISRGEGYTTSLLRPLTLHPHASLTAQPETSHAPLYPLLLAIGFNLLSPSDRTVALVATLCGLLTALLVYALTRRLADRVTAGIAALIVSLNVGFLSAGVEGAELPLLALLITLLGYLLVRHAGRPRDSAWCGAACGLLYLTEYATLPLLLPVAAVVTLGESTRRRAHLLACLLGFAVLAVPWLARDWAVSGGPLHTPRGHALASATDSYPLTTLYRLSPEQAPTSLDYLRARPRELVKKGLQSLGGLETKLPAVLEGALLLLLGLAILGDAGSRAGSRLRWALLGGAALVVLNLAFGEPRFDVLYGFLGVAAALGAIAFRRILAARGLSSRATGAVVAGLLALAASQLAITTALSVRPTTPDRQSLSFLQQVAPKGSLVVTDEPWSVAWYSDRPALWLPQERGPDAQEWKTGPRDRPLDVTRQPAFLALERAGVVPYAIFLTSRLPSYPEAEEMLRWQLLRQQVEQQLFAIQRAQAEGKQVSVEPWAPPGWVLYASFPSGEYLFLREGAGTATDARTTAR